MLTTTRFYAALMNRLLLMFLGLVMAGCVTFYPSPSETQPAALLVEKGDRRELGWYESFSVSEIDGFPVSHIGTNLGSASIRVAPGLRRILITATYRHGSGPCPCRIYFPLEIDLQPSQVVYLDGSFTPQGFAILRLVDGITKQEIAPRIEGQARPVPKNMYVPVGGGAWIPISRPAR